VEQEGVLEDLPLLLADPLHLLELAVAEGAGVGEQPPDQRRLAVVDVADDHDVHGLARQVLRLGLRCGLRHRLRCRAHHMYPSRRSFSIAYASSWSWARPARSGTLVARSSTMISGAEVAVDWILPVQVSQPIER